MIQVHVGGNPRGGSNPLPGTIEYKVNFESGKMVRKSFLVDRVAQCLILNLNWFESFLNGRKQYFLV